MPPLKIEEVRRAMIAQGAHWYVPFMDLVDDCRRMPDLEAALQPWPLDHAQYDALLASTLECLCAERGIESPAWLEAVPVCAEPWFVSGIENLKAMAIVQSPVWFRRRKIFVLENFLARV